MIYSVSTKHYFAFGALVSEELSYKLKELPGVRWVLPDSYLDVKNKDYGGEPFVNREAVTYDPKYHEEWVQNNARANERNGRNDRPHNSDRSRNFERRRENMQNFQNRPPMPPPPLSGQDMGGQGGLNPSPAMPNTMPPRDGPNTGVPVGGNQMQTPNYQNQMPPRDGGMAGGSYPLGNNAHQGSPNAFQGGAGGYQGPPNAHQGGPGGYQAPLNPYQGDLLTRILEMHSLIPREHQIHLKLVLLAIREHQILLRVGRLVLVINEVLQMLTREVRVLTKVVHRACQILTRVRLAMLMKEVVSPMPAVILTRVVVALINNLRIYLDSEAFNICRFTC